MRHLTSLLHPFEHSIAVTAMFRDEARWLAEWIEYHKLLGVLHFYLYNNHSTDDYYSVLKRYVGNGLVELIEWPYEAGVEYDEVQRAAYSDALLRATKRSKWLAAIDIDEFLVPIQVDDLSSFLSPFETDSAVGGVCAAWVYFGTSYVEKVPRNQLMVETLVLNGGSLAPAGLFPWSEGLFKSIVRPDRTCYFASPHAAVYKEGYQQVASPYAEMQINHYWTKDQEFFNGTKIPRAEKRGVPIETSISWAAEMNRETPFGDPIRRFIPSLRKRLG